MIYKEFIADRYAMFIKLELRPARWTDWLPVIWLWAGIVWRPAYGGDRLDAKTAWKVSEGVCGIVRDADKWDSDRRAISCRDPRGPSDLGVAEMNEEIECDSLNHICQQCEYWEVCYLENHANSDYCPRRRQ